jgi:glutaredoxin-related protein
MLNILPFQFHHGITTDIGLSSCMQPTSLNYTSNNDQCNNGSTNGRGALKNNENNILVTDHLINNNSEINQKIVFNKEFSHSHTVNNTNDKVEQESVMETDNNYAESTLLVEDEAARNLNTSKDESRLSLIDSDNINDRDEGSINNVSNVSTQNETEDAISNFDLANENDQDSDSDITEKFKLQKGMQFAHWTEFEEYFEKYTFYNFTHTCKRFSKINKDTEDPIKYKYNMAHLTCVHFGKPRVSQSTKQRPNQSYMGRDCMFEVVVKFDGDINKYYIDRVHADHNNHEVSKHAYMQHPLARRLKDQELNRYVKEYLMELKVSKATIKDKVEKETGKKITSKDLQNLKEREKRKVQSDTVTSVINFLEKEKDDNLGSVFRVLYRTDAEGVDIVKAIFWESNDMKEIFRNNASVVFMDGTYGLSNCGFTTITFSILDNHKKTNLIAWGLVSNERQETMQEALKLFKEANAEIIDQVAYVVVDKDFTELAALAREMPDAEFIICRFHAIQAVTRKLQSIKLDKEIAKTFANAFNKMVFSPDEDEYNANWDKMINFEPMTPDVKRFCEYIDNNWHAHRDHFAMHLLKSKKLYDSYTNNRTEGQNQKLKQRIRKRSPLDVVVKELLSFSKSQKNNLQGRDWSTNNKTFIPTDIGNDRYKEEIVRVGNDLNLSKRIIEDILKQYELLHLVNEHELSLDKGQTICSRIKKGPCTFSSSNHLPCKHLLYVRRHNLEVMLD